MRALPAPLQTPGPAALRARSFRAQQSEGASPTQTATVARLRISFLRMRSASSSDVTTKSTTPSRMTSFCAVGSAVAASVAQPETFPAITMARPCESSSPAYRSLPPRRRFRSPDRSRSHSSRRTLGRGRGHKPQAAIESEVAEAGSEAKGGLHTPAVRRELSDQSFICSIMFFSRTNRISSPGTAVVLNFSLTLALAHPFSVTVPFAMICGTRYQTSPKAFFALSQLT